MQRVPFQWKKLVCRETTRPWFIIKILRSPSPVTKRLGSRIKYDTDCLGFTVARPARPRSFPTYDLPHEHRFYGGGGVFLFCDSFRISGRRRSLSPYNFSVRRFPIASVFPDGHQVLPSVRSARPQTHNTNARRAGGFSLLNACSFKIQSETNSPNRRTRHTRIKRPEAARKSQVSPPSPPPTTTHEILSYITLYFKRRVHAPSVSFFIVRVQRYFLWVSNVTKGKRCTRYPRVRARPPTRAHRRAFETTVMKAASSVHTCACVYNKYDRNTRYPVVKHFWELVRFTDTVYCASPREQNKKIK